MPTASFQIDCFDIYVQATFSAPNLDVYSKYQKVRKRKVSKIIDIVSGSEKDEQIKSMLRFQIIILN